MHVCTCSVSRARYFGRNVDLYVEGMLCAMEGVVSFVLFSPLPNMCIGSAHLIENFVQDRHL